MTAAGPRVNGAESVLKSELTLSAVGEVAQHVDGGPAVPRPSLFPAPVPPAEAIVRDERDPYVWTEAELRLAWGDR